MARDRLPILFSQNRVRNTWAWTGMPLRYTLTDLAEPFIEDPLPRDGAVSVLFVGRSDRRYLLETWLKGPKVKGGV